MVLLTFGGVFYRIFKDDDPPALDAVAKRVVAANCVAGFLSMGASSPCCLQW